MAFLYVEQENMTNQEIVYALAGGLNEGDDKSLWLLADLLTDEGCDDAAMRLREAVLGERRPLEMPLFARFNYESGKKEQPSTWQWCKEGIYDPSEDADEDSVIPDDWGASKVVESPDGSKEVIPSIVWLPHATRANAFLILAVEAGPLPPWLVVCCSCGEDGAKYRNDPRERRRYGVNVACWLCDTCCSHRCNVW